MNKQEAPNPTWDMWILGVVAFGFVLMIGAVAGQALFELLFWIRDAKWPNWDWYAVLDDETIGWLLSGDLKGVNEVIKYILDCWVSLPVSAVGMLVLALLPKN